MAEAIERTFVSSVVFLDVIGYSKEPVAEQIALKKRLNQIVSAAIAGIAEEERIMLDTGDGIAISFLGDPEVALASALSIQKDLIATANEPGPTLQVRIGINLGSVKLLRDINGQPNLVGDGINVAQRVMSFAKPNQILAARSFFEVVSCLTHEYRSLFSFSGTHKDKHVREHEVYEVSSSPSQSEQGIIAIENPPSKYCEVVFSPDVLRPLEATLARFLGPLAAVLMKKAIKSVANLTELCETLSELIPVGAEREIFIKSTKAIILGQAPKAEVRPLPAQITNPAPNEPAQPSQPVRTAGISPMLQEMAAIEFSKYIGPLGQVVAKKVAASCSSFDELCKKLGEKIPSADEREDFLEKMEKRIRR